MKVAWRLALLAAQIGALALLARSELDFVYRSF
jgi:hypothetical protein